MIHIAKPYLGAEEAEAAGEAVLSGWVTQGPRVKKFEEEFAAAVGAKYACAVSSCTAALHLALLGVGVRPGDAVITVSHSFVATANAVRYCFAEPVFVDIDPHTFNMDPAELEKTLTEDCVEVDGSLFFRDTAKLAQGESPLARLSDLGADQHCTGRIAAIMPVHQMGMPCDMDAILSIAERYKVPIVEDAACAIGSETAGERIGRPHGSVACFSFHPRKVITTGDGGMLTTNDEGLYEKFRLLRQHAMSVADTKRHDSKDIIFEEYLETAFNYRMTDIQGAIGIEQLKKLDFIIKERRWAAQRYSELLAPIKWLHAPIEPAGVKSNWQSYPVSLLEPEAYPQREVMQRVATQGVSTRRGIMNAHQEPPYAGLNWRLPVSEAARDTTILLPLFVGMTDDDIKKVVDALKEIQHPNPSS